MLLRHSCGMASLTPQGHHNPLSVLKKKPCWSRFTKGWLKTGLSPNLAAGHTVMVPTNFAEQTELTHAHFRGSSALFSQASAENPTTVEGSGGSVPDGLETIHPISTCCSKEPNPKRFMHGGKVASLSWDRATQNLPFSSRTRFNPAQPLWTGVFIRLFGGCLRDTGLGANVLQTWTILRSNRSTEAQRHRFSASFNSAPEQIPPRL